MLPRLVGHLVEPSWLRNIRRGILPTGSPTHFAFWFTGRGGTGAASGGREGGSAGADHPAGPRPAHHLPCGHELQHLRPGQCDWPSRPPEAATARHHQARQWGGQHLSNMLHLALLQNRTEPSCVRMYQIGAIPAWYGSSFYNVRAVVTPSQHALYHSSITCVMTWDVTLLTLTYNTYLKLPLLTSQTASQLMLVVLHSQCRGHQVGMCR